jgi:uncharacterized membrane protein YdjX (TVP38/TMEM64 family)
MARSASLGRALKYFAFIAVLIALVVVPFLLFGAELEAWSLRIMADDRSKFAVATAGALLLASDVVLPIPSTVVISALGALLGGTLGLAVAVAGLTLGCVLGYVLGRILGHDFALRQLGQKDFAYLASLLDRHGLPILALCRTVPVLAEASVIAAGVVGMPMGKTLLVTGLANLGFAGVYALLGASAESAAGFLAAFAASLALPGLALLAANRARRSFDGGSTGEERRS